MQILETSSLIASISNTRISYELSLLSPQVKLLHDTLVLFSPYNKGAATISLHFVVIRRCLIYRVGVLHIRNSSSISDDKDCSPHTNLDQVYTLFLYGNTSGYTTRLRH